MRATASSICRGARPSCSASAINGTATVRVKYLGRAPLNGDDSYERKYLASQSWMQFAAKGKTPKMSLSAASQSKRRCRPKIRRIWRSHGKRWRLVLAAAPAASGCSRVESDHQDGAACAACRSRGSIPRPGAKTRSAGAGLVIQAGSFKNKDNADKRARTVLAAIAPVEVTPVEVGAETSISACGSGPLPPRQRQKRPWSRSGGRISRRQDRDRKLAPHSATGLIFAQERLIFAEVRPLGSGRHNPPRSRPGSARVRLAP